MELQLPPHIETLARDLKDNLNTEKVLLAHLTAISQDISLYHIYVQLGYSPDKAAFLHTPTRVQALQLLSEEFGQIRPEELTHDDLKEEFYRTFKAMQIGQFTSPGSLGLNSAEISGELPRGMYTDDTSLMDFWGNTTPQKPEKMEIDFETPCKTEDVEARSSKGLRSVSLRVKEIVRRRGKSSYKDVADVLVKQLNLPSWADRPKEEKNIRRRVYDALNVLIAADVIGRQGRDIILATPDSLLQADDNEMLGSLKQSIVQKQHHLRELAYDFMGIRQLISRRILQKPDDRIDFPFIVVATEDSPSNRLVISTDSTCQSMRMRFKKEAVTVGDSDIVRMMPFQRPWNFQALPREVRELLEGPVHLFS
jgi:hypothetical protein